MSGQQTGSSEPDVMEIYDQDSGGGLTCRVCGSLVDSRGGYPKVHWDWHETPFGA